MKRLLAASAIAGSLFLIASARAAGEGEAPASGRQAPGADWSAWTRPLAPGVEPRKAAPEPEGAPAAAVADAEVDVVDAHWMALTMWGEARSGGEEAMRAVGHVIANRRAIGRHGDYVTETVSEAWQFSAWNRNDPNRAAMLNIDSLPQGSEERRRWECARRLADDILAGRSADPTGGALFYHTPAVSPRWSQGVQPSAFIGGHLFFRTAG